MMSFDFPREVPQDSIASLVVTIRNQGSKHIDCEIKLLKTDSFLWVGKSK